APYCWTEIDLGRSDSYGYRSLSGGIDGEQTLRPTHQPTPTKLLAMERFAQEAAGYVVRRDLAPGAEPLLLTTVTAETVDEAAIRAEIAALHLRILGVVVTSDSLEVGEMYGLFTASAARGDTTAAWKLVISSLLRDPRILFY
ncbi:MAG: hypothetical protein H0V89_13630, partial [Deltaproteobacteria bacterium]|nr:hypothetical protein [Deltaproteobacteria bacterium]